MSSPDSSNHGKLASRPRTQGFVTKRAHKKSRAGCRECKVKKIKCDENRPECKYCKNHHVRCVYNSHVVSTPTSSSTDELSMTRSTSPTGSSLDFSSGPEFSLSMFSDWNSNDLSLLHHYSTMTSNSLSVINRNGADQILQVEVLRLAFEHDFMMHCILGIASLHLHHLVPDVPEYQSLTLSHRVNAMSGMRLMLSRLPKESYRAVMVGSILLLVLAADLSISERESGSELWIGNWLGLWAGMRDMIQVVSWKFIEQSGLAPIFIRDKFPRTTLGNLPPVLMDMLMSMDPKEADTKTIESTLGCLCRLYEYLLLNGFTHELNTKVIAWPANTDIVEYSALAKRNHPQALVVAAYYLAFTKIVDKVWWIADIASHEIESIASALPTEFHSHMIIPLQAAQLQNKFEVASLLLSQLPGGVPHWNGQEFSFETICSPHPGIVEEI